MLADEALQIAADGMLTDFGLCSLTPRLREILLVPADSPRTVVHAICHSVLSKQVRHSAGASCSLQYRHAPSGITKYITM